VANSFAILLTERKPVLSTSTEAQFEIVVLQHLDAAYNLARRLLKNEQDAEDVVQDAAIRAFKALPSFRGTEGKAWFLTIVRNTGINKIRRNNASGTVDLDAEGLAADPRKANPEELVIRSWQGEAIEAALNELPLPFLEVVVLRELEDMSYKEIAEVTGQPIGTVMSRLARARQRLQFNLVRINAIEVQ
jgi:RNA polymerase sigma-70 factor, ECF subfamily